MENLIWNPLYNYYSGGDNIQICDTVYKGVRITWRTRFYWDIFKDPSDNFELDLILPISTKPENGYMQEGYCEQGYGYPAFDKLENAIKFIDKWKNSLKKKQ